MGSGVLVSGPPQDNSGEALKEPERAQEHSLPNFAGGQHFFEYLLVVSLKKKRSQDDYEPIITYQFPKVRTEGGAGPVRGLGCLEGGRGGGSTSFSPPYQGLSLELP